MKVSVPDDFGRQHVTDWTTMQHTCPYPLLYLLLSSGNCLLLLSSGNCLLYTVCLSHARWILRLGAEIQTSFLCWQHAQRGQGTISQDFMCTAIQQLSTACPQQRHGLIHCFTLSCHSLHPSADSTVRLPLQEGLMPLTSAMTSAPRRSTPMVTPTLGSTAMTGARGWVCTW